MRTEQIKSSAADEIADAENKIAALLSIIPGLGQVYKGHFAAGFLWMFLGMPLAIWIGILLGLATGGLGLLFPIACWAGLGFDAYYERDLRKHHWFVMNSHSADDGDEFED